MTADQVTGISIIHIASADGCLVVVLAHPMTCGECGRTSEKWKIPLDGGRSAPAAPPPTAPPKRRHPDPGE